jgi:NADH:ubiquinone oxidoreductase subunit E
MSFIEEIRKEARDEITTQAVTGLWEDGQEIEWIARVLKIPIQEVEAIVNKIQKIDE